MHAQDLTNIAGSSEKMLDLRTLFFPQRQDGVLVMKKQEIQAVITSFVADFQMRSKLTMWRAPTAKINGGWCMCMMKQEYEGPKVCGYQRSGSRRCPQHAYIQALGKRHISRLAVDDFLITQGNS